MTDWKIGAITTLMAYGPHPEERKRITRNRLISLFKATGALSKIEARKLSGYSMDALIGAFLSLESEGFIAAEASFAGISGKVAHAERYRLVEDRESCLGIGFTGEGIHSALVGLSGALLARRDDPFPGPLDSRAFVSFLQDHLRAFYASGAVAALRWAPSLAVIAVPGDCDWERAFLRRSNLLPEVVDVDLAAAVRSVAGDVRLVARRNVEGIVSAALKDGSLSGDGGRTLVVSAISAPVHALVQDGILIFSDGEMEHLSVAGDGPVCRCGRTGCVGTLFSATAFGRLFPEAATPASIRASLAADEAEGRFDRKLAVDKAFDGVADALLNLCAAFSPHEVLLTGALFGASADPEAEIASRFRRANVRGDWIPRSIRYRDYREADAAIGLCLAVQDELRMNGTATIR